MPHPLKPTSTSITVLGNTFDYLQQAIDKYLVGDTILSGRRKHQTGFGPNSILTYIFARVKASVGLKSGSCM